MADLVVQMIIAERYGVRLNIDELAELLDLGKSTIYNQISAGTFPIATYLDCNKRYADYRDVAAHLEACRDKARLSV